MQRLHQETIHEDDHELLDSGDEDDERPSLRKEKQTTPARNDENVQIEEKRTVAAKGKFHAIRISKKSKL